VRVGVETIVPLLPDVLLPFTVIHTSRTIQTPNQAGGIRILHKQFQQTSLIWRGMALKWRIVINSKDRDGELAACGGVIDSTIGVCTTYKTSVDERWVDARGIGEGGDVREVSADAVLRGRMRPSFALAKFGRRNQVLPERRLKVCRCDTKYDFVGVSPNR